MRKNERKNLTTLVRLARLFQSSLIEWLDTVPILFCYSWLTKKNNALIISNEVRSLLRKELRIGPGGGDEIKKINRPISLGKEGFPGKKMFKDYSLFWELSKEK